MFREERNKVTSQCCYSTPRNVLYCLCPEIDGRNKNPRIFVNLPVRFNTRRR